VLALRLGGLQRQPELLASTPARKPRTCQPVACIMAQWSRHGSAQQSQRRGLLGLDRGLGWTIGFADFACDRPDRGFALV
jgi:hypothetical protein